MSDDFHKQMMFEQNRKSVGLAYLLWFFFGAFGVHRFYSGRTGSGIAQLILTLTGIGLLVVIPWLLIDLFLIPGIVREENLKSLGMMGHGPRSGEEPRPAQPRRQLDSNGLDPRREAMLEDLRKTGYRKERRDTNPFYR